MAFKSFYTPYYNYGSGGQYRLRLDIEIPPTSLPASSTVVRLTINLYLQTSGKLDDTSNLNRIYVTNYVNPVSGSTTVHHPSGGGNTLIMTRTDDHATGSSAKTIDATGSITDWEALTDRSVTGSVVIPAEVPGSAARHRNPESLLRFLCLAVDPGTSAGVTAYLPLPLHRICIG